MSTQNISGQGAQPVDILVEKEKDGVGMGGRPSKDSGSPETAILAVVGCAHATLHCRPHRLIRLVLRRRRLRLLHAERGLRDRRGCERRHGQRVVPHRRF